MSASPRMLLAFQASLSSKLNSASFCTKTAPRLCWRWKPIHVVVGAIIMQYPMTHRRRRLSHRAARLISSDGSVHLQSSSSNGNSNYISGMSFVRGSVSPPSICGRVNGNPEGGGEGEEEGGHDYYHLTTIKAIHCYCRRRRREREENLFAAMRV